MLLQKNYANGRIIVVFFVIIVVTVVAVLVAVVVEPIFVELLTTFVY